MGPGAFVVDARKIAVTSPSSPMVESGHESADVVRTGELRRLDL
jgi:hypothetical protein